MFFMSSVILSTPISSKAFSISVAISSSTGPCQVVRNLWYFWLLLWVWILLYYIKSHPVSPLRNYSCMYSIYSPKIYYYLRYPRLSFFWKTLFKNHIFSDYDGSSDCSSYSHLITHFCYRINVVINIHQHKDIQYEFMLKKFSKVNQLNGWIDEIKIR